MLLAQSTFSSLPLEFSFTKYSHSTKVAFFGIGENNKLKSRKSGNLGAHFNGYTYFTSPHHPLESELTLPVGSGCNGGGIGIHKFYRGKNIFITGATGLLGKAYVNGLKEGIIHEKPLMMGENGRNSSSLFPLDLSDEINIAFKSCLASTNHDATKHLKRLGLERAAYYGWYNAYHMTKAMAEMVLNEIREDVPLLILRPSVIESCYKDPIPGWIQGNRMYDPVMISYGKGKLPAYLADPHLHTDIVPVDMVANTAIAAIAKHGITSKPQLNVYHVASDFVNPLRFSDMFDYIYEHFSANPLNDQSESIAKMKLFNEFTDFSKYVRDELIVAEPGGTLQRAQKLYKAKVAYAEQLCKMYEFIGFFKARFHTRNARKLLEEMSKEEQDMFEIDATKIDWRKYFVDIHIPGLRKHVLNATKVSV